jgi:hypothetical protein
MEPACCCYRYTHKQNPCHKKQSNKINNLPIVWYSRDEFTAVFILCCGTDAVILSFTLSAHYENN